MFLSFKKYGLGQPYDFVLRRDAGLLPLDKIEVARSCKVDKLPNFDSPFFRQAILWMTDVKAFESLFLEHGRSWRPEWRQRSATRYRDHLLLLESWDLITSENSGVLKYLSTYFEIAKKDETTRAIFNGKSLSRIQRTPPPVNLAEVPVLLRTTARIHDFWQARTSRIVAPSVWCADIRHYFHELEISSEISKYFGVACGGLFWAWRALPMGWSYSPRCAQSISWAIVLHNGPACLQEEIEKARSSQHPPSFVHTRDAEGRITGIIFIWYDNFTVITYNNDHHREVVANIENNRKTFGLHWSGAPDSFSPTDLRKSEDKNVKYPSFLGVQIRVVFNSRARNGEIRSYLAWRCEDKLFTHMKTITDELKTPTRRLVARAVGYLIWRNYVQSIPLLELAEVIEIARENAPKEVGKRHWDDRSPLDERKLSILISYLNSAVADTRWYTADARVLNQTSIFRVVSDSSDDVGAFIFYDQSGGIRYQHSWHWKSFGSGAEKMKIFLKELMAATIAIEKAAEVGYDSVHIAVDNTAAGFVISRGYSKVKYANELLRRIFRAVPQSHIIATHIRSIDNAADPLTRGRPLNDTRTTASWSCLLEAEKGWPKTQEKPEFRTNSTGGDSESDSEDESTIRHDEEVTHDFFDSEDDSPEENEQV